MATRYQIQLHYQNALRQAARLETLADNLNTAARDGIGSAMDEIRAAWTGENADAYLKKGEQLEEKTKKTAKALKSAASAIRTIAVNTYKAEMNALEIANKRSYGGGIR